MFSPIGKKRVMLKNYWAAKETGRPVEQVAARNAATMSLGARSLSSMSSVSSFNFSDDGSLRSGVSTRKKKRAKNKKYLNPNILDETQSSGDRARKIALRKLTHAAVRFRKDRDGLLLSCFETRSLNYDEFRIMLKKVFFLDFTDEEYKEVFELFDTDKSRDIDGSEFLVYFTHLATIWKNKEKRKLMRKKQSHEESLLLEEQQRQELAHAREAKAVDYDYDPADHESAEKKLAAAAKHYIKGHPAAKNIDAFEVAYLSPFDFKNLCLQTFDLKLTAKEVGALVDKYDYDDKGMVKSPSFIVQFLKLGNELRMVDHSRQVELTRAASAELLESAARKTAEMEAALERGIEKDFTEEDQRNAVEKLRLAAVKFDKNHPSSLSLDGFNSKRTTPGIFREMLKRTFNLILPSKELGALVKFFDTDNSDTVNNDDFLTYFTRASTTGRFAMRSYMIAKQKKMIQDAEDEHQRKLNEQWGKLEDRVKYEFSEDDVKSATEKITDLARKYFNDKVSSIGLKAFQVATMGPAVWREMMKRSFFLKISDGELAYFIHLFGNSRREIDCTQFVLKFNALVFEERSKARTCQLKLDHERDIQHQLKETARIIAVRKRNEGLISHDFTDEDYESALSKLRAAALKHDKNHPAAVSLEAFEVSTMPAADFQELCRRVFRIDLTGRELGAIVSLCGSGPRTQITPSKRNAKTLDLAGTIDNSDNDSMKSARVSVSGRAKRAASSHLPSRDRTKSPPRTPLPHVPEQSMIDCNEFMLLFSRLQRIEKSTVRTNRVNLLQQIQHMRAEEVRKLEEKSKKHAADLITFGETDFITLMKKLNDAAQKFSIDNAAYLTQLQNFKGPSITAASFRETFFRIFLIKLTFAEIGALTNFLNPELAKESLINGNTFLTSFYKLSRLHEKILLGIPIDEDINSISCLRIGIPSLSRSSSRVSTSPGKLRPSSKLPDINSNGRAADKADIKNTSQRGNNTKNSTGCDPDALSRFKYSAIFSSSSIDDFVQSRQPPKENEAFPFSLDSPRSGVISLNKKQLPSPSHSAMPSPRSDQKQGSMLSRMFSGLNPWTASQEDLEKTLGVPSPLRRSRSPSPTEVSKANSRNNSPNKMNTRH